MCLLLSRLQRIPRIALHDIPVFKVLRYQIEEDRRVLISPYQETIYDMNETYHSKLDHKWAISHGTVDEGLHSYVNIHEACRRIIDGNRVFHAVIPRGSIYYRGTFGGDESIASNKLRVTHEVPGINPPGPNSQDEYFDL